MARNVSRPCHHTVHTHDMCTDTHTHTRVLTRDTPTTQNPHREVCQSKLAMVACSDLPGSDARKISDALLNRWPTFAACTETLSWNKLLSESIEFKLYM